MTPGQAYPQINPTKPTESSQEAIQPVRAAEDTKQPGKLLQKTLDAIKLCEAGLSPREALQCANMTTRISAGAVSNFKAKMKKHSLTDPGMVLAMSSQVKRILKARARQEGHTKVTATGQVIYYTDNVYPTDSNILAACAMVADRVEPIIHQVANLNLNVDLSPVDLSGWDNGDGNVDKAVDNSGNQPPCELLTGQAIDITHS